MADESAVSGSPPTDGGRAHPEGPGGFDDKAALSEDRPRGDGAGRSPEQPFALDTEPPELAGMIGRVLRSLVRRAESGDIDAVEELAGLVVAAERALAEGALAAHEGPAAYSWGEIARTLGVTRQAARERFGRQHPRHRAPEPGAE